MTSRRRLRRIAVSLTVRWALIALALRLVGQALDRSATLARCIAPAALLGVIGEAGDWLRRRWRADRLTKRLKPTPARLQAPETETPTMRP
ncbi:hypothetical protein PV367_00895 [Streptomyces europaeiscabiei]|uniref:Uncharacterized protein n=1 Tax=Streptomyces europaeiscabiei TaxID=146819 RepID=A0AAJ2PJI8_9ACTN|nr:hypothetical protein [Streptomyces europaeiscabiei]MDX3128394.1 hypothetical protein [Streptomyces europaeiscabiei]